MCLLRQFLENEQGQSMMEYGVLIGSVAATTFIALDSVTGNSGHLYDWVNDQLPNRQQLEQQSETHQ